jgi:hypothetical protein
VKLFRGPEGRQYAVDTRKQARHLFERCDKFIAYVAKSCCRLRLVSLISSGDECKLADSRL